MEREDLRRAAASWMLLGCAIRCNADQRGNRRERCPPAKRHYAWLRSMPQQAEEPPEGPRVRDGIPIEHGPNGAQRRAGGRPADRCERISLRCAPSPRREIHQHRTCLAKVAVAGAPVWRGEGAAREGALARYEPLPLPLPGDIQEGIAGAAAGAVAGAAAAAFGFALRAFFFGAAAFFFLAATTFLVFFAFLAFAFDFFAFFAMFDLPIALAIGPTLM